MFKKVSDFTRTDPTCLKIIFVGTRCVFLPSEARASREPPDGGLLHQRHVPAGPGGDRTQAARGSPVLQRQQTAARLPVSSSLLLWTSVWLLLWAARRWCSHVGCVVVFFTLINCLASMKMYLFIMSFFVIKSIRVI